ncbi:metallophosphoesterase family protein [Uniformispora flossi]|uniref:metallophosphoesterase family protein n=1 Tax=Uniformispora flossi TaxID=3390723 RepID=UPI003C2E547F
MRILLTGDVHGNLAHVRTVLDAAAAEHIDRIFQLGDFGYWEHEPGGVRFLDEVHRAARAQGITVYFLDGNHDKSGLILERYGEHRDMEGFLSVRGRVRYAPRGHVWTWDGVRFLAFGGACSVDREYRLEAERRRTEKALRKENYRLAAGRPSQSVPDHAGTLWFPEEEATDADAQAVIDTAGPVDVLLTHDKPRATTPGVNRKDLPVCHPNQDRIQRLVDALRPRLAAHGHLHHRYTQVLEEPHAPTRVEGLAADPVASFEAPGYRVADSWLVLDTATV